MPDRRILILTALRHEARALERALGDISGVTVRTVGIGAKDLSPLTPASADCIILAGLAGGLDPACRSGDVIIEPRLANLPAGIRPGRIHTSSRLVCTPAEKASLFAATAAACVDMETDTIARAARSAGIPFITLRVILDAADQALPAYLLRLMGPDGGLNGRALVLLLLRRPWSIVRLIRLSRDSRRALSALAAAIRALIESPALWQERDPVDK